MAGPDKWTGTGPRKDGFQECGIEVLSANHDAQLSCEDARANLRESGIGDNGGVVSMTPDQAATTTAPAVRIRIMMDIAPSLSAGSSGACSQPALDVRSVKAPLRT